MYIVLTAVKIIPRYPVIVIGAALGCNLGDFHKSPEVNLEPLIVIVMPGDPSAAITTSKWSLIQSGQRCSVPITQSRRNRDLVALDAVVLHSKGSIT